LNGVVALFRYCTFPALETLSLRFFQKPNDMANTVTQPQFRQLYQALYPFLGRHAGTLKNLVLDKPLRLSGQGQLPRLPLTMHNDLVQLNLTSLQLFTGSYEAAYSMDASLAEGATQLEKLVLVGQPIHQPFNDVVLRKNVRTLRELTWISAYNAPDGTYAETPFDMGALAGSTTLTRLELETTILLNFRSLPHSLTHLELRFSLVNEQIAQITNLTKLRTFIYRRNSLPVNFFNAFSVANIRELFYSSSIRNNIQKVQAYCGDNLGAIQNFVEATPDLELESSGHEGLVGTGAANTEISIVRIQ